MTIKHLASVLGVGFFVSATSFAVELPEPVGDDYDRFIETRLRESESPRDWMLAAEITLPGTEPGESIALMSRAAEAAPNDALVQWIAMEALSPKKPTGETLPDPRRARRLAAVEPDNAAHWLPMLALQADAKDTAAVDGTLAKMAAATRFDEHYRDHLLAWADVHRRFPRISEGAGDTFFLAEWLTRRVAFAPDPAYSALLLQCHSTQAGIDLAVSRREHCSAIARRMVEGRTDIARTVGYVILSRTGRNTSDDDTASNTKRWIRDQWSALIPWLIDAPGYSDWWVEEWRSTGVETTIMRRWLEREGRQTVPPPGWQPKDRTPPKS